MGACVRLNESATDEVLWKIDDIGDDETFFGAEHARAETNRYVRPCLVFLQSQLSANVTENGLTIQVRDFG